MAKARSPEYPAIGLKEAIEKVKAVYEKDYQNKLPKLVMATHMGYKGLNGTSLPALSAMSKYGLIEGRGDETRVSDLGLAIVAHAPGTPERVAALRTAASSPELFAELDAKFPGGKASDAAIRSYLLTQRFIPSAADTAIRSYRETNELVQEESSGYDEGGHPPADEPRAQQPGLANAFDLFANHFSAGRQVKRTEAKPAMIQEVFNLEEGQVSLSVPAVLSPESYQDMADRIEIFLRGLKRRSDAEAARRRHDRESVSE